MYQFEEYKNVLDGWLDNQRHLPVEATAVRFKKTLAYLIEIENKNSIRESVDKTNSILSESIEQLKTENEKTYSTIIELENLISEKETLIQNQNKIEENYNSLLKKKNTIADLESKKKEIERPENAIDALNDEIINLNGCINEKINDYILQLNALNKILEESKVDIDKESSHIIKQLLKNIKAIESKQFDIFEKLSSEPLKTIYAAFNDKVNTLTEEYNKYVVKIESIKTDLEKIENSHLSIVESFKQHKLENERIFGALQKVGEKDGVLGYLESEIKEISDRLKDFDENLKILIRKKSEMPIYERI